MLYRIRFGKLQVVDVTNGIYSGLIGVLVFVLGIACISMSGKSTLASTPEYSTTMDRYRLEQNYLRTQLIIANAELINLRSKVTTRKLEYMVDATAYSPSPDETDSTPWETAILVRPIEGRTIAVSQDLVGWLGKRVYIVGYGVFVVEDLMNKRFTKRIDFFFESKKQAADFGIKRLKVVLLY